MLAYVHISLYTYLIPVSNDGACILVFCRGGVICGLHPCEPNKCQHPKLFLFIKQLNGKSARMATVYTIQIAYICTVNRHHVVLYCICRCGAGTWDPRRSKASAWGPLSLHTSNSPARNRPSSTNCNYKREE